MPRRPRLELPGVPMHITHRGVNRAAVFLDADDYEAYRLALHHSLGSEEVALHAYVLMTNHVHLLVSAPAAGAISRAMREVGQRYVPRFNRKHGRTGTLWDGRFKSCLVQTQHYLLRVYRYIELNPVRAAMVEAAEAYRWSSVHANLGIKADPLVTPHQLFCGFTKTPAGLAAYRAWLQQGCSERDLRAVRSHLRQERALGNLQFQEMVARTLNRPVACRPRGRPPRASAIDAS